MYSVAGSGGGIGQILCRWFLGPFAMPTQGLIMALWKQYESPFDRGSSSLSKICYCQKTFFCDTHNDLIGCNVL